MSAVYAYTRGAWPWGRPVMRPGQIGLERTRRRAEWIRFEDTETAAFFERVRAAYLALAAEEPDRFEIVDGSGSVEAAEQAIRAVVERRFYL